VSGPKSTRFYPRLQTRALSSEEGFCGAQMAGLVALRAMINKGGGKSGVGGSASTFRMSGP
jgi:hypothetical protein